MSDRKIDSPFLFDCGSGVGTYREMQCGVCKTVYNKGCNDEDKLSETGISWATFGGKEVCECCYHIIENAVYPWVEDIIKWYRKIIAEEAAEVKRKQELLGLEN